jgi:hypothetical protein
MKNRGFHLFVFQREDSFSKILTLNVLFLLDKSSLPQEILRQPSSKAGASVAQKLWAHML